MTGDLTLNGDPVNALQAATKQYVDSKASAAQSSMSPIVASIVFG